MMILAAGPALGCVDVEARVRWLGPVTFEVPDSVLEYRLAPLDDRPEP